MNNNTADKVTETLNALPGTSGNDPNALANALTSLEKITQSIPAMVREITKAQMETIAALQELKTSKVKEMLSPEKIQSAVTNALKQAGPQNVNIPPSNNNQPNDSEE
ncbi:hypothetical protein [Lihuaxuella thermophila]|uniref:Uncharacterized protein n=1 Tax=Lihuaxuella thermophila TaxID=1173111 RepID=A0A1H8DW90_9BACL|nr:hypothetical protein [Lihuaxuella thermophila]SEN11561.1 hypothetical protein SAMN05444955_10611 [Lihuaxuella thermophila]